MHNSAEYWRRAQAAFEQARQVTNENDKATWLRVAGTFEALFLLARREEAGTADTGGADPDDPCDLLL
jgi:hypothetical protein